MSQMSKNIDNKNSPPKEPKTTKLLSTALSELVEMLDKKSNGERYYHSTGFAAIDRQLSGGLLFGNLIVLASRPAMVNLGSHFRLLKTSPGTAFQSSIIRWK